MTDRTDAYCRRLDAHLAIFTSDAGRIVFLRGALAHWQRAYAQFQRDVMREQADLRPGHPTAFDYVTTITAVGGRLSALEEARRVAA